jgi:hypothetical protein
MNEESFDDRLSRGFAIMSGRNQDLRPDMEYLDEEESNGSDYGLDGGYLDEE